MIGCRTSGCNCREHVHAFQPSCAGASKRGKTETPHSSITAKRQSNPPELYRSAGFWCLHLSLVVWPPPRPGVWWHHPFQYGSTLDSRATAVCSQQKNARPPHGIRFCFPSRLLDEHAFFPLKDDQSLRKLFIRGVCAHAMRGRGGACSRTGEDRAL